MENTNPYETPESDVSATSQAITYDESKWYSPSGRLGRARYFMRAMGYYFILLIAIVIVAFLVGALSVSPDVIPFLLAPLIIVYAILTFVVVIKRLHDLEWTGWLLILMLVPMVNFVFSLVLLLKSGSETENKYGNPPHPAKNALLMIVGAIVLIALVGIVAAVSIPAYQDYVNRAQSSQAQ